MGKYTNITGAIGMSVVVLLIIAVGIAAIVRSRDDAYTVIVISAISGFVAVLAAKSAFKFYLRSRQSGSEFATFASLFD